MRAVVRPQRLPGRAKSVAAASTSLLGSSPPSSAAGSLGAARPSTATHRDLERRALVRPPLGAARRRVVWMHHVHRDMWADVLPAPLDCRSAASSRLGLRRCSTNGALSPPCRSPRRIRSKQIGIDRSPAHRSSRPASTSGSRPMRPFAATRTRGGGRRAARSGQTAVSGPRCAGRCARDSGSRACASASSGTARIRPQIEAWIGQHASPHRLGSRCAVA